MPWDRRGEGTPSQVQGFSPGPKGLTSGSERRPGCSEPAAVAAAAGPVTHWLPPNLRAMSPMALAEPTGGRRTRAAAHCVESHSEGPRRAGLARRHVKTQPQIPRLVGHVPVGRPERPAALRCVPRPLSPCWQRPQYVSLFLRQASPSRHYPCARCLLCIIHLILTIILQRRFHNYPTSQGRKVRLRDSESQSGIRASIP